MHTHDDDRPLHGPGPAGHEHLDLPIDLLAVNVGNTNTRFTIYHADGAHTHAGISLPNTDLVGLARALSHAAEHLAETERAGLVIASTNHAFRDELLEALHPTLKLDVYRIGADLQIPIHHALTEAAAAKTGQDRFLNALGAFDVLSRACVVIDAGTAITVDFVDGEGVFQGGAIAPGLRMQLRSLHEGTTALPLIEPRRPDPLPFGQNTEQAILNGVIHGIGGVVQRLTERYAEHYGAYPPVVATGGDAPLLFEADELIDRIVPDLTLRGIAVTCREALGDDE